jgi:hypothetical protein
MHYEAKNLKQDIRKTHNINIANSLYTKLSNHIQILKNFENRSTTNQNWIANAIKKKIEKTENSLENGIHQKNTICIKIDPNSLEKITEQVEILKKHTGSYSKTKWILEAIMDQLEEEQEKARELLKK